MRTIEQRNKHIEYMRKYNIAYSIKTREKRISYRLSRLELTAITNAEYWNANKEYFSEWRKMRRICANELVTSQQKRAKYKYRGTVKFKETDRIHQARRRRRVRSADDGTVTAILLREMLRDATNCVYCKKSLDGISKHIDHKHPLSLGGLHSASNITICCGSCNSRKGALPYDVWMQRIADGVNKT